MPIQQAVGLNALNLPSDVAEVQRLLGANADMLGPMAPVAVTGVCDAQTIGLIKTFQQIALGMTSPSGQVEPDSPTWFGLNRMSGGGQADDRVEEELRLLNDEFVNFAARFIQDAAVRKQYLAKAQECSNDILARIRQGKITAKQGAQEAHQLRDGLLDAARTNNSDIGLAVSEAEKATGKTFEELLAKYSGEKFNRAFSELSAAEQDVVFVEIAKAAGRPNVRYTALARNMGKVGKGLLVVSIAFSVYSVATSDRPGRETAKQGVGLGAGWLGAAGGGALAGLACGPGAPVCVGVGALVGGLAFALGADTAFDWFWK